MNKRIQELMTQSMVEYQFQHRFSPEKFAELIVRECAGVCEDYRGTEWGKAAECIGDSIKEHFGVKE
jgi:hypothetical protein